MIRDHDFAKRLVKRAKAAGCSALVLTLDLQIMGQRHKDIRNGLSTPPKFTPKHLFKFWQDQVGVGKCCKQKIVFLEILLVTLMASQM